MDNWLTALISVAGAGLVAFGARFIDRRRGVPTEIDSAIDSHVKVIIETLEKRLKYLEASEQDCKQKLAESAKQLADEVLRGDRLEGQVNRLLHRLEAANQ